MGGGGDGGWVVGFHLLGPQAWQKVGGKVGQLPGSVTELELDCVRLNFKRAILNEEPLAERC